MTNKEKYKREIKSLRKLLDDNEYTRTIPVGYHSFISEMHRKLVSNYKITPKMLNAIHNIMKNNSPEELEKNKDQAALKTLNKEMNI